MTDWDQELNRLNNLVSGSPERNRRALPELLKVVEKARPENTLDAAKAIWWMASIADQRMKTKEAELLYALAIGKMESIVGPQSPLLAGVLHSMAYYLCEQGLHGAAEPFFRRIVGLMEFADSQQRKDLAQVANDFADCLTKQGKVEEAELVLKNIKSEG